jgi:diaminohydroxyphosphoribosylaminopyrimidine deaminase / 5-amino-6-(5-phosphoribosylamino)uracil reductase
VASIRAAAPSSGAWARGSPSEITAPDRAAVLSRVDDASLLRRALGLAEGGWGRVAPNPLVGAVVVREGEVVGEGFHRVYGGSHAEVEALAEAGERARGATLYVTLEPCAHEGRTPPCTEAILRAGIARVVFGSPDPNPAAAGGAALLREAGVEVEGGVEADAERRLNAPFHHAYAPAGSERPWVALKLALSLDGGVADLEGRSRWITGEEARAEVHRLRAGFDAVAVGAGTAIADDPELTVRGAITPRVAPVRVVFDRRLRLPRDGRLARTAAAPPVWVVTSAPGSDPDRRGLEAEGVRMLESGTLAEGLRQLSAAGIRSLLCEGGAGLASAFLRDAVVDRLYLFYAPLMLGPEALSPFHQIPSSPMTSAPRWRHLESRAVGADTLLVLEP